MTSFVHVDYSLQHPGVVRAERAAELIGHLVAGSWVLRALAAIGRPVVRLAGALQDWTGALRSAREDAAYWNAALSDARIMADISRAMDAAALEQRN
jgi:hypothetical protein